MTDTPERHPAVVRLEKLKRIESLAQDFERRADDALARASIVKDFQLTLAPPTPYLPAQICSDLTAFYIARHRDRLVADLRREVILHYESVAERARARALHLRELLLAASTSAMVIPDTLVESHRTDLVMAPEFALY